MTRTHFNAEGEVSFKAILFVPNRATSRSKKNHRLAISTYSDDKYENEISAEHPISLGEIIKAQISADDLPNYFEFYVGKGSK